MLTLVVLEPLQGGMEESWLELLHICDVIEQNTQRISSVYRNHLPVCLSLIYHGQNAQHLTTQELLSVTAQINQHEAGSESMNLHAQPEFKDLYIKVFGQPLA